MEVLDQISICLRSIRVRAEPRSDHHRASSRVQGQAEYLVTRPNAHMAAKQLYSYMHEIQHVNVELVTVVTLFLQAKVVRKGLAIVMQSAHNEERPQILCLADEG